EDRGLQPFAEVAVNPTDSDRGPAGSRALKFPKTPRMCPRAEGAASRKALLRYRKPTIEGLVSGGDSDHSATLLSHSESFLEQETRLPDGHKSDTVRLQLHDCS
ncbi:unnamed protein product, partial [Scytosiphon promiscuus]